MRQEPGTVLLIEVDDHLRVGPCLEAVPPGLEQSSQFDEVVYLAVQDNPHGAVLIGDGLPAGIEIDDGKAPTRQADRPGHIRPRVVWPAVRKSTAHLRDEIRVDRPPIQVELACDAAHGSVGKRRRTSRLTAEGPLVKRLNPR